MEQSQQDNIMQENSFPVYPAIVDIIVLEFSDNLNLVASVVICLVVRKGYPIQAVLCRLYVFHARCLRFSLQDDHRSVVVGHEVQLLVSLSNSTPPGRYHKICRSKFSVLLYPSRVKRFYASISWSLKRVLPQRVMTLYGPGYWVSRIIRRLSQTSCLPSYSLNRGYKEYTGGQFIPLLVSSAMEETTSVRSRSKITLHIANRIVWVRLLCLRDDSLQVEVAFDTLLI